MKREDISNALGDISTRHITEAESYVVTTKKIQFFKKPFGRLMIAVILVLCVVLSCVGLFSPFQGMAVTAYAYGTDKEITSAGVTLHTGTISDNGELTGHPLMFYLSGENIASVRFSCKNQQISFMDWTEKRNDYGLSQNFTVNYGKDESEYKYLLIDWVPNSTIRELTDKAETDIATLPDEMRKDIIVMEITFENGKTETMAIKVSLLDDGTFFAVFDHYKIGGTDSFVKRPDNEVICYYDGQQKPNGDITGDAGGEKIYPPEAEQTARGYYANTIFEVISMKVQICNEKEVIFAVCVSKDGIVQEPDRTITLQLNGDTWEVVNEGY